MKIMESSEMLFCPSILRALIFILRPSVGSVVIMRRMGVNSCGRIFDCSATLREADAEHPAVMIWG